MKSKGVKLAFSLLIFCLIILPLSSRVFALEWDGSSSGGGGAGTPANANGYAIRTTADNCIGYRFSVVDKAGNTKNGSVIDIFRNTTYGNFEFTNAYKFNAKRNKVQNINNQNNGFSSSKNTWFCYKESDMAFANPLPTPEKMNIWQNDGRNLNPVLSTLGVGTISNLKNGDKVIVEPLYDIRIQGIYHSVTVTEIALYGKWLLGANSNGGSSPNANSWGFISTYTNRHYPNSLFTPNGQGLWAGTNTIDSSSRATFYDIINKGFGAGIAYTETKADFTPSLKVNVCEAWKGSKSSRYFHYGTSNGSSFGNFTYKNGYPILNDSVWFAVNFPAETENIYVRQSVRLAGGAWTTRNVYSNNNTWFDIASSPTVVGENHSSYIVEAKTDWIDSRGNVLKYGPVKTFYIPIQPKINCYQVSLTDIAGRISAYGGISGYSSKVYVGQRVYPKYTFTSENTWTSYNNFTGSLCVWENNSWQVLKASGDMVMTRAGINKSYPYSNYSSLYPYRVQDNSSNNNGANRIPFFLTSAWYSDSGNTSQSTWIDIPIIKSDVELLDIRLISEDGYYISGSTVLENDVVTIQYIYRNNTDCTVYVEGYKDDQTQINGIYAIPAYGQKAVNGRKITIDSSDFFGVWGGVYLEGAGLGFTDWERNGNNNHWTKYWEIKKPISIKAIKPNSEYREGVEVITSFQIYNTSYTPVLPNDDVQVKLSVYQGSVLLCSTVKNSVVIPGAGDNLVYFKWTVPKNLKGSTLTVKGEVIRGGIIVSENTVLVQTATVMDSQTPNTNFEREKPLGWTNASIPPIYTNSALWSEWVYINGSFQKNDYGIALSDTGLVITPGSNSPSAKKINGIWEMKSGYGYSLNWILPYTAVEGRSFPTPDMFTEAQNGYAMFPEYRYLATVGQYRTLDILSGIFSFKPNIVANGERIHFIPIWYPNGLQNYAVSVYAYDCWTPAGMIVSQSISNSVTISGSMYDDYFLGRQ